MTPSSSLRRDPGLHRIVAGVFAAALAIRLVYLWQLSRSGLWDYLRLDPLYYHDWAVRIASGDLLGTQPYEMTPLYAYALGAVFKVLGYGLAAPRLIQAGVGAGVCALIAALGARVFTRAEGIAAGLTLALYGPALFHEAQIMKTAATVALSTATAALLWLSRGVSARLLTAGGALMGVTALCQENINMTLPVLLAWIAWRAPSGRRIACCAALVGGWAVAVAPATLRNYAVSGDVVLITSGGGEVFYTGNNEHASGHYRPPAFVRPDPFFEHEDFRAEAARRLGRPAGSITRKESDAFWWREGVRFIARSPGAWARLLGDKVATYFTAYERPDNYSYYNFMEFVPLLRLPLPHFGWIAPLGLVGLALSARRWADLLPLHAVMGCYFVSALLFFTQDRYRMPMVPLLALFAAHAAVRIGRAARGRSWGRLAGLAAVSAALAAAVNRDPGNDLAFEAQNHGILGEMRLHAGRPREAAAEFRRTLSLLEGYPGDSAGGQHRRLLASAHMGILLAREAEEPGADDEDYAAHAVGAAASPDLDTRTEAVARLDRLGPALAARGDFAGAAKVYTAAVAADASEGTPSFSRRLRLAEALHRSGRPRDALAVVEEALRRAGTGGPPIDPVILADAHYGEALILLGDLPDEERAARHLAETLRLNPSHPRAAWIRATLATLEAR